MKRFKSYPEKYGMKLSERFRPARSCVRNLLVELPLTSLDNRLFSMFPNARPLPHILRPSAPRLYREWSDGAVQDWGRFIRCRGVLSNFGGSEERENSAVKENADSFFKMLLNVRRQCESLPRGLHRSAEKDAPAGAEIHSNPAFFINARFINPTLLFNQLVILLETAAFLQTPVKEITLWLDAKLVESPLKELMEKTFRVRLVSELQGVHWFRELICFTADAWQRLLPYRAKALRQNLLPAFGIPIRKRCKELRKIMLISRHDHPLPWGMNVLTRKISNEMELVTALSRHFPGVEVQGVRLEELSAAEQLRRTHESDLLLSMHGAGLGFAALLPENAAVLELFPLCLRRPHYFKAFYNISVCNRLHYRRWINLNPRREYCSDAWAQRLSRKPDVMHMEPRRDFTRVPPPAVVRRVKALQRCIRRGAGA